MARLAIFARLLAEVARRTIAVALAAIVVVAALAPAVLSCALCRALRCRALLSVLVGGAVLTVEGTFAVGLAVGPVLPVKSFALLRLPVTIGTVLLRLPILPVAILSVAVLERPVLALPVAALVGAVVSLPILARFVISALATAVDLALRKGLRNGLGRRRHHALGRRGEAIGQAGEIVVVALVIRFGLLACRPLIPVGLPALAPAERQR